MVIDAEALARLYVESWYDDLVFRLTKICDYCNVKWCYAYSDGKKTKLLISCN